jgi:hypothetical protein
MTRLSVVFQVPSTGEMAQPLHFGSGRSQVPLSIQSIKKVIVANVHHLAFSFAKSGRLIEFLLTECIKIMLKF